MVKTILEEVKQAPNLFEETTRLQQENIKLKQAVLFLERQLDRFKPNVAPDIQSEALINLIKAKAQEFCLDNSKLLIGAELVIETAMMIGASVALGKKNVDDDRWEPVDYLQREKK
jgi:hypothetical protein